MPWTTAGKRWHRTRSGKQRSAAHTHDSLGLIHDNLGEPYDAAAQYQESVDLSHAIGDGYSEADVWTRFGDAHAAAGDQAAARDAWQHALAILDALDEPEAAGVRAKLDGLWTWPALEDLC